MSKDFELICGACRDSLGQITLQDEAGSFEPKVVCVGCQNNPNGVPLNLEDSATHFVMLKKAALTKTVKDFLSFDALRLFPRMKASSNFHEYTVVLGRTESLLPHHETLEKLGVKANDTLIITEPLSQL